MAEHSIFSGAPPWEPSAENDGDPSIVTAVAFYSTATPWWVVGGRCRVPASRPGWLATVTLALRIANSLDLIDLSTAPVASAVATVADGWCEARFPTAVPLAVGQVAWMSMQGVTAQDVYLFVGVGTVGLGFVQADDASDLYLAEAGTTPGLEQPRSAFRIAAGATTLSQAWYGLDLIANDQEPALTGDASLSTQVTISATGSLGVGSTATLPISFALSATGFVSGDPGLCEPLTVTTTGPELTMEVEGPTLTASVRGSELTMEVTAC